jgi:hypothetical protein
VDSVHHDRRERDPEVVDHARRCLQHLAHRRRGRSRDEHDACGGTVGEHPEHVLRLLCHGAGGNGAPEHPRCAQEVYCVPRRRSVDDHHVVRVVAHQLLQLAEHEQVVHSRCDARHEAHDPESFELARDDPEATALQVLGEGRPGREVEAVRAGGQGCGVSRVVDPDVQRVQSLACGNCRKCGGHHRFPDPALARKNEQAACGEESLRVHWFFPSTPAVRHEE